MQLTNLASLWNAHRICVPVMFKTACVLLNSHITGRLDVLFATLKPAGSGRSLWDNLARYLPNPLAVAGLTFAVLVNSIGVDPAEKVGSLLTRLESEQQELTFYSHTLMLDMLAQLDSRDRQAVMEATRKLSSWQPN